MAHIKIDRKENTGYKGNTTYNYFINYGSYPETVKVYINPRDRHASFYSEGNVGVRNFQAFQAAVVVAMRIIRSWEARWEQEAADIVNAARVLVNVPWYSGEWYYIRVTRELHQLGNLDELYFSDVWGAVNYLAGKYNVPAADIKLRPF